MTIKEIEENYQTFYEVVNHLALNIAEEIRLKYLKLYKEVI